MMTSDPRMVKFYHVPEYGPGWIFFKGPDGTEGYIAALRAGKEHRDLLTRWGGWITKDAVAMTLEQAEAKASPEAWAKLMRLYPDALNPYAGLEMGPDHDL